MGPKALLEYPTSQDVVALLLLLRWYAASAIMEITKAHPTTVMGINITKKVPQCAG